jgi:hypothetical protein
MIVARSTSKPLPPMTPEQRAAVEAYATSHHFEFVPFADKPIYAGTPFGYGKPLGVTNVMRSKSGRPMEFGNFSYAFPLAGENALANAWDFAYLALKLDRNLPQISLQAKGSPVLWDISGQFPVGPDLLQRLTLEGDFNKYFYFYCPKEYETDALYVFTPDVMALFIDEAQPFDAEFIDNWLFIYSRYPFGAGDTVTYDRLLRIVDLVGAKVVHQTDLYRDDRVGNFSANVVAAPGRRLARRIPWQVWLILGVAIAIPIVIGVAPFVGLLFAALLFLVH